MYIQRQMAILDVCKLQFNIGPTYLQTLLQRVTNCYDMCQMENCYSLSAAQRMVKISHIFIMKVQNCGMKYVTF